MRINKAEIRTLIPHSDLMCLLDEVVQWDDRSIVCVSNTHRDPVNPLRRQGRLSAVHAFEYGAQAAAIHGGLRARAAGTIAPPGYLAALRDGRLHVTRLDHIHLPLRISRDASLRRRRKHGLRVCGFSCDSSRSGRPGDDRRTRVDALCLLVLVLVVGGASFDHERPRAQRGFRHITMPPSTHSTWPVM